MPHLFLVRDAPHMFRPCQIRQLLEVLLELEGSSQTVLRINPTEWNWS